MTTDPHAYIPIQQDDMTHFVARQAARRARAQGPHAVAQRLASAYATRRPPARLWVVLDDGRTLHVEAPTRSEVQQRHPSATVIAAAESVQP